MTAEEALDFLRRGFAAFSARDREAWMELVDEDLVAIPADDWPEPSPAAHGREAAWEFFLGVEDPWESGPYELTDCEALGNDRFLVRQQRDMRGKASGAEVHYDYWLVSTVRGGKLKRMEWFRLRSEALRVVEN